MASQSVDFASLLILVGIASMAGFKVPRAIAGGGLWKPTRAIAIGGLIAVAVYLTRLGGSLNTTIRLLIICYQISAWRLLYAYFVRKYSREPRRVEGIYMPLRRVLNNPDIAFAQLFSGVCGLVPLIILGVVYSYS